MELHFGYNCKYFLPTLGKCRTLIETRRGRNDLAEHRWLSTEELLVYLNVASEELFRQITSGQIRTTLQKDGKLMFWVSTAGQYDDCFLANGGGQCLYFEPHKGKTISCLAELKGLEAEHPNYRNVPSESDVKTFEENAIKIIKAP